LPHTTELPLNLYPEISVIFFGLFILVIFI